MTDEENYQQTWDHSLRFLTTLSTYTQSKQQPSNTVPLGAFNLLIGTETSVMVKLLADPHAVAQGFVLFQMDRNITFLYLIMHQNTSIDAGVCTTVTL